MNDQIIGLHDWFATPPGRYLLAWERAQLDLAVADIFGFHALQLGMGALDALAANRMPHRWLATDSAQAGAAIVTDFSALPFPASSLDLVVLPHSLELCADPHTTLREVERVLVPEGRVVICGLNPVSLWGLRQRRAQLYHRFDLAPLFLPQKELIGYWRLRDWLRLLGFEVELGRFGCYRPAFSSEQWLQRLSWMERAGARWWPILGAVYFVVAVKRVRGVTLLSPAWKASRVVPTAPVSVVNGRTWTRAQALGACRALVVESVLEERRSQNWPQRGQFLPDLQAHSPAMGQKDGVLEERRSQKWTAAVNLQPTIPKSDRLLDDKDMRGFD